MEVNSVQAMKAFSKKKKKKKTLYKLEGLISVIKSSD